MYNIFRPSQIFLYYFAILQYKYLVILSIRRNFALSKCKWIATIYLQNVSTATTIRIIYNISRE